MCTRIFSAARSTARPSPGMQSPRSASARWRATSTDGGAIGAGARPSRRMPVLSLLYRAGFAVSRLTAWIGLLLILAAALLTCADIGLRNVGFRGIIGMIDLTQLFVLAASS